MDVVDVAMVMVVDKDVAGNGPGGRSGGRGHGGDYDDGLYISSKILNSMTSAQRAAFFEG